MKKILTLLLSLIVIFAVIFVSSCNGDIEETGKETTDVETTIATIEKIESATGAYVEGDSFDSKSVFVFSKMEGQSEAKEKAIALLENEIYNKESDIQLYEAYIMVDNQTVQPQKELTVTIPKSVLSIEEGKGYLLYHINDEKAELIDYTETGEFWQFSVSHCSLFVIVEEYREHVHEYGELHSAVQPTLFSEGNIAYYKCEGCGLYFDENKTEVEEIAIKRKTIELVLVVNGRNTADFVCTKYEDNLIEWKTDIISFSKNELLSVVDKNNDLMEYEFTPDTDSNITSSCNIHNKAEAEVVITCTPDGMFLSVGGYREEVVYLRVSRGNETIDYPMTYLENTIEEDSCYFCGYYNFFAGDSVSIIDDVNGTTYGFDNISKELYWNDFTCERGDNNSIVVKKDVKLGFGVYPSQKEVIFRAIFSPNNGKKYTLKIRHSSESSKLFNDVLEMEDETYQLITFFLDQMSIENIDENLTFLKDKNLSVYMTIVNLSKDSEIRLYDETNKKYIGPDHLIKYLDDKENIQISGSYFKLEEKGVYILIYLPFTDCIYIMNGNSYTLMEPTFVKNTTVISTKMPTMAMSADDENIFEELNVHLKPSDYFTVCYNLYPYTSLESGRMLVINYGDVYKVETSGYYNIRFNKTTQKVSIELVSYDDNPIKATWKLVTAFSSKVLQNESVVATQNHNMTEDGNTYRCTLTLRSGEYILFVDQNGRLIGDLVYDSSFFGVKSSGNNALYCYYSTLDMKVIVTINKSTHVVTVNYA